MPDISTIQSVMEKILHDDGWSVTVKPSYNGGVTGICWMNVDEKIFSWTFELSDMDLIKSPMEIVNKIDGLRSDATSRMCSGAAI